MKIIFVIITSQSSDCACFHLEVLLIGKHSSSYWNACVGTSLLKPPQIDLLISRHSDHSEHLSALLQMCLGNHNCHQLCISQNTEIQSQKECNHPNPIQLKRQMGILKPLRDYNRSWRAVGYCMGSMGLSSKCVGCAEEALALLFLEWKTETWLWDFLIENKFPSSYFFWFLFIHSKLLCWKGWSLGTGAMSQSSFFCTRPWHITSTKLKLVERMNE